MSTIARGKGTAILAASLMVLFTGHALAALPFITDDTGTLGQGTSQVEWSYERSTDKETVAGSSVKTDTNQVAATFGHGIAEKLDLTLGFTRPWGKVEVDGFTSNDAGSADFTLNAKWRLYEQAGLSFTVKPQVGYSYFPGGTSNDQAYVYGATLIASREVEPFAVHLNARYQYTDYRSAAERAFSRSGIWSLSALATYKILEELELGCDVGASANGDKASSEIPVYALAGVVYSPNKNVDLSLGFKFGVTRPEPDFAGTAGITIRF